MKKKSMEWPFMHNYVNHNCLHHQRWKFVTEITHVWISMFFGFPYRLRIVTTITKTKSIRKCDRLRLSKSHARIRINFLHSFFSCTQLEGCLRARTIFFLTIRQKKYNWLSSSIQRNILREEFIFSLNFGILDFLFAS